MRVNEIFEGIQGEGRYVGHPALFIRLCGCTRNCSFCDTSYHNEGKEYSTTKIANIINKSECEIVVWTGGEPMLHFNDIETVIMHTNKKHHMETNGDLLPHLSTFDYICFSPKCLSASKNVSSIFGNCNNIDIKIATDLDTNKDLIPYATMLMPLTFFKDAVLDTDELVNTINKATKQHVWNYCSKHKIKYCPRLHVDVWDGKKGI